MIYSQIVQLERVIKILRIQFPENKILSK